MEVQCSWRVRVGRALTIYFSSLMDGAHCAAPTPETVGTLMEQLITLLCCDTCQTIVYEAQVVSFR